MNDTKEMASDVFEMDTESLLKLIEGSQFIAAASVLNGQILINPISGSPEIQLLEFTQKIYREHGRSAVLSALKKLYDVWPAEFCQLVNGDQNNG